MNDLAIIIPMYNEEANAERCVRAVSAVLQRLPGTRLFVVNDGSRDRTLEVLNALFTEKLPFQIVSHTPNRGFGGALLAGINAAHEAGFTFGLMMDSDLTNDPELIPKFVDLLATGSYDLIKASRYVKGGGMKGVPLYRRLFTICGNKLAYLLFNMGIHDCTNGFHAVRLSLLAGETFQERGFPFLLEEMYVLKKKGVRAAEIPYILTARKADEGQSKFHYSAKLIWNYLKYALRAALVIPERKFL